MLLSIIAHLFSSRGFEISSKYYCFLGSLQAEVCEITYFALTTWKSGNFRCDDLIFGPKRREVTGGWIKLRNDELHGCTPQPIFISRRVGLPGHV